jgi:hypothetical protein
MELQLVEAVALLPGDGFRPAETVLCGAQVKQNGWEGRGKAAKRNCPVSKALAGVAEITLLATPRPASSPP